MRFDLRPLLRRTFMEISRKYPYLQTPSAGGVSEAKQGALVLGSCKASLLEAWLLHVKLVS